MHFAIFDKRKGNEMFVFDLLHHDFIAQPKFIGFKGIHFISLFFSDTALNSRYWKPPKPAERKRIMVHWKRVRSIVLLIPNKLPPCVYDKSFLNNHCLFFCSIYLGEKVCVRCETEALHKSLGWRCQGHGVEGRVTRWSALTGPHCHGKWLRVQTEPDRKCAAKSCQPNSAFIFVWKHERKKSNVWIFLKSKWTLLFRYIRDQILCSVLWCKAIFLYFFVCDFFLDHCVELFFFY